MATSAAVNDLLGRCGDAEQIAEPAPSGINALGRDRIMMSIMSARAELLLLRRDLQFAKIGLIHFRMTIGVV